MALAALGNPGPSSSAGAEPWSIDGTPPKPIQAEPIQAEPSQGEKKEAKAAPKPKQDGKAAPKKAAQDKANTKKGSLEPDKKTQGKSKPAGGDAKAPQGKTDSADDLEKLLAPFIGDGLLGRLTVAAKLRKMSEDELANRVLPRMTGERNRLILKVRNLIEALGDVRYEAREAAEKTLINMGPAIKPIVDSMSNQQDLEISIRLRRVKDALEQAGTEDIERKALIARGLAESMTYRPGLVEARASHVRARQPRQPRPPCRDPVLLDDARRRRARQGVWRAHV